MDTVFMMKLDSPFGQLQIFSMNQKLVQLLFENETSAVFLGSAESWSIESCPCLQKVKLQIDEYFLGQRKQFDLEVFFHGTEFQKNVWKQLETIPFGTTKSYTDIAQSLGKPKAVRAVGGAIGKNPIPLIYPCHRVLGMKGQLTGFLGGLKLKEKMLQFESRN